MFMFCLTVTVTQPLGMTYFGDTPIRPYTCTNVYMNTTMAAMGEFRLIVPQEIQGAHRLEVDGKKDGSSTHLLIC